MSDREITQDHMIINLEGSFQGDQAALFRDRLIKLLEKGHCHYIINFARVEQIDATGLGVLVTIQKRVLRLGGTFILQELNGEVAEVFLRTRLYRAFRIEKSGKAA